MFILGFNNVKLEHLMRYYLDMTWRAGMHSHVYI